MDSHGSQRSFGMWKELSNFAPAGDVRTEAMHSSNRSSGRLASPCIAWN